MMDAMPIPGEMEQEPENPSWGEWGRARAPPSRHTPHLATPKLTGGEGRVARATHHPPNLLASLLPRVDARLGLGVVRLRPDGTEAYATFYTPNNLAWVGEVSAALCAMPGF